MPPPASAGTSHYYPECVRGTRAPQVSPLAGGVRLKRGSQDRQFALNGSLWDTRGWTFQEMHLSRRRVIFTAHEVMCECAESAVTELDLGEVMLDPSVGDDPLLYLVNNPNLPLRIRNEMVLGTDGKVLRRYTAFGRALLAYQRLVRYYLLSETAFV